MTFYDRENLATLQDIIIGNTSYNFTISSSVSIRIRLEI